MALFTVSHETALPPHEAWARVTDWPRHGDAVPLTRVEVTTPGPNGVGTTFVARTAVAGVGFDDPMTVVAWEPPPDGPDGSGRCRLEKQGRVMLGWAELTVAPIAGGSKTTWREDIAVAHLPGFANGPTALSSRLLFGRVLRKLLAAPR